MPSLFSSIYKQKMFLVGTNFAPWAYVRDYVIFQIWKTLWRKESGAAAPPYIHWVQAHVFVRNVLDVLSHCI
jgi:hypothetical protein